MITCMADSYVKMFGNITEDTMTAKQCISQCTGCMCNCRCTCSGSLVMDLEWEAL